MLVSSSTVSIALSSGVVVFFTSALFFSGYAIQQRTLRDLRASIKPQPRHRPEDLMFLPDRFKKTTTELADGTIVAVDSEDEEIGAQPKDGFLIEIRPTLPLDREDEVAKDKTQKEALALTPEADESNDADVYPPGESPSASQDLDEVAMDGEEVLQKPISAAERRRRIKNDIQKLAGGSERGYYQRRLW